MNKLRFALTLAVSLTATQLALAQSVKFDIAEFSVEGNTLLPIEKIQLALTPFTGAAKEMSDVTLAADALRALYQAAGYPVVQVVSPVQTITAGKVLLKVVEDKITAIEVAGNTAFDADNIRASLPALQVGKSLNAKQLEAAVSLANENSAKQVAVNVQPEVQPGDIITTINVTEDSITKFVATYDNTGSEATGYDKIGLTYQNANLFNRDHALTLQYNGSIEHVENVYSFSLGYHIPFYQYGISADVIAAYSSSSGQNGPLYFAGKGTVLGARLNYPLPSVGDIRQKLILGIDYKDSESVAVATTPITETPVSLSYTAQVARPEFQGNASATYLTNIAGGNHGFEDDYFKNTNGVLSGARIPANGAASDNFPSTKWQALRLNGTGGFALPNDWQARVGINAQFSGDLLLPSEQFGAGGASSVRGYPERIISGDEGYSANFELYTPELNKHLGWEDASVRALLFWDIGGVTRNDRPLPAGLDANIEGVGFGVRLTYKKNTTFKFDIGWAQKAAGSAPLSVNPGDTYSNIALSIAF